MGVRWDNTEMIRILLYLTTQHGGHLPGTDDPAITIVEACAVNALKQAVAENNQKFLDQYKQAKGEIK